jgi:CO/xanthine dehydrogenase Mo-binding subunit
VATSSSRRTASAHWKIEAGMRGLFKQRLLQENWPVEDLAGFAEGDPLPFRLRTTMRDSGKPFRVRRLPANGGRALVHGRQPGGWARRRGAALRRRQDHRERWLAMAACSSTR